MTTAPTHAATVVLVRDRAEDLELFMVKRHGKSAFMASAYVYPGGKLDARDATPETARHCRGRDDASARAAFEPAGTRLDDDVALAPGEGVGVLVAAIREVFEESGVLLASDASGQMLSFEVPEVRARFEAHRSALNAGTLSMTALAEAEGLTFSLDALRYFAHWITPAIEPRRFNARFFIARAPEGQEPLHDAAETVESQWVTPSEALALYAAGTIQLAPPTMRTLEDMAAYRSVDALLAGLPGERLPALMPRFEELDGMMTLLLPGDPLYPSEGPVSGATRFQLDQGRWWSRKATAEAP